MPALLLLVAGFFLLSQSSGSGAAPKTAAQPTPQPQPLDAGDVALTLVGVGVEIYKRYLAGQSSTPPSGTVTTSS